MTNALPSDPDKFTITLHCGYLGFIIPFSNVYIISKLEKVVKHYFHSSALFSGFSKRFQKALSQTFSYSAHAESLTSSYSAHAETLTSSYSASADSLNNLSGCSPNPLNSPFFKASTICFGKFFGELKSVHSFFS